MFGRFSPSSVAGQRWLLGGLCGLAFALSLAYLHFYLRGGPRIIDATSYFLEARSLAAGGFSFHVPDPTASFRGRFLLASSDGHTLGVLFPPGYPLVLSLGMRLGAPLLVGPTLGALLVAATYLLARALGETARVALLSALLSALSGALRYHTADTMSHGLSALLGVTALALALRSDLRLGPLLSGACLGLLLATRPVSGGVACTLVGFALRRRPRSWPALLLAMIPGISLLLLQQHALTGSFLGSTQLAYYRAADAPAGCFRYGFGAGVGCRFEHGQYVERFIPEGFGLRHALRNLGVHLLAFTTDATNLAPLTLLGGYALIRHRRSSLGLLGAGIALQALAYLPFYFDGDYPGGGARFLCEAIPLCQILVARAASDLGVGFLVPPLMLGGFVLSARHGHEQLRDREGGRPMFEADVVERAGVERGLVLVDSDHGFNLGFDPRALDARRSLVVARARGDAHDWQLFLRLGRPATYRYVYDFKGTAPPKLVSYLPPESSRLEAEAEWPALLDRGSAYPIHYPCASGSRALRLLPGARVKLWVGEEQRELRVGWVGTAPRVAHLKLGWAEAAMANQWTESGGCVTLSVPARKPGPPIPLLIELVSGEGALDYTELVGFKPAIESPTPRR
jgi:hypothetical protein